MRELEFGVTDGQGLVEGCEVNGGTQTDLTVRFHCVGRRLAEGCEVKDGTWTDISRVRVHCTGRTMVEGCEVNGGTWTDISLYGFTVQSGH